jgi:hypothetical protein
MWSGWPMARKVMVVVVTWVPRRAGLLRERIDGATGL